MHINSHFAIGIIMASIFHSIYTFSLLEYSLIVISGFITDFDIFFSKYARDGNHRMLISHSVLPGLIILFIGFILFWPVLIISGVAFIVHIVIDTLDWGTNFLGFHNKPFGPKFLISKEELENLDDILAQYKVKKSFFDFRYYSKKTIVLIEILLLILMIISMLLFAIDYLLLSLLYIPFLLFHLLGYLQLKKIESKKD